MALLVVAAAVAPPVVVSQVWPEAPAGTTSTVVEPQFSWQRLATMTGHRSGVDGIAFAPDGRTLASIGFDLRVWDVGTGQQTHLAEEKVESLDVLAFAPDGTRVVTGGFAFARRWNTSTWRSAGVFRFNEDEDMLEGVAFSPDSGTLAFTFDDASVRIQRTSRRQVDLVSDAYSMAFIDNATIVVGGKSDLRIRDISSHTDRTRVTLPVEGVDQVATVFGEGPVIALAESKVWLWKPGEAAAVQLPGSTSKVRSIALSPDAQFAAAGQVNGKIAIWDLGRRRMLGLLEGHSDSVSCLAFSPDGLLASGGKDHTIRVWKVELSRAVSPNSSASQSSS
jgi:WD40 repeat protein